MSTEKKIMIKDLKAPGLDLTDVKIEFGDVEEYWDEPMGPTPMPSITDLREWDFKLLKKYPPLYIPNCDMCCFCAYGKCDLTKDKRGACGIGQKSQLARKVIMESIWGAAAHGAHSDHLLHEMIRIHGADFPIDMGPDVLIEAPIYRVLIGKKPKTLGDLVQGVEYAKNEIFHLTSSLHAGMEGSYLDRESKAMHAGLMDNLLMEIGDITQIATYNFPKGVIDVPLVQLGPGTVDKKKPVITCIGHNVMPAAEVISYLEDMDLMDDVEVCGICCTAHDMARRNKNVKIVGNLSKQLKFIGTGISDVVMLDEQCVREDIIDVARNYGTVVIATNDKVCLGLDDRTGDSVEAIVEDLATGKAEGVLILDAVTAGHVAVQTAQRLSETRKKRDTGLLSSKEIKEWAGKCTSCEACLRTCPVDIHISDFMKDAKEGNFASFVDAKELCVGCMRCDYACETGIPITHVMDSAARNYTENYVGNVRMGRGPITDVEIRNVGRPLVFGEIPGIVVFAGCSNVPNSEREIAVMAEEFLKRNFIVVTTGCAAMSLGSYKDEEGKTLYDKYPGEFDAGGLTNLGSCVSNAHALGAAIKVAHIFAKRPLRGNFEEVADYIHNRVGVVAVVWGTYSQKAHAICTGLARWGIPVLYGPSGMGYTRLLVGRKDKPETFKGFDARSGDEVILDMCPDELITIAENMEEAIVKIARNVMRPNDGAKGRVIKISHYMDIHKKYFGTVPDDLHLYIRNEKDIPITMKDEVMAILEKTDWVEKAIPDPTMVERLVRK